METEGRIVIPTEDEIVRIHNYLVGAHKGLPGIINSPGYVPGFCNAYLSESGIVPTLAFILSRLSKGHYFVDGNKRTAYFTGRYTALRNGFDFNGTSPEEAADQMVQISELDPEKSRAYAETLVRKELIDVGCPLETLLQFERLVLKSIAVSNKLSRS